MNTLLEIPSAALVLPCHRCQSTFEPSGAAWCACDRLTRSLVCPSCGRCFCDAPVAYRRTFWSTVPAEVRQDPRRFAADRSAFPTVAPLLAASPAAPVVVVTDDDEAFRSLVACYADTLGYRTRVTGDPFEALELAQERDVRVLVTDAFMPRMDGRELCRRLKLTPSGELKKTILVTSLYTARHFKTEAFRHFGVDEYLCKPLNVGTLGSVLRRFAPLPPRAVKMDGCPDSGRRPAPSRVA